MARLIIGVDPHKRSATIEVIDDRERVLGHGRYGTDTGGYQAMLAAGRRHANRVWAGWVFRAGAGRGPCVGARRGSRVARGRRNWPRKPGSSTPATAAKPIRTTPTTSP